MTKTTKQFKAIALLGVVFILGILASCRKDDSSATDSTTDTSFNGNSLDTSFTNAIYIKYAGSTVTVENPYAAAGVSITVSDGKVTVNNTDSTTEYNYVLSGNGTASNFKLYSNYKSGIILNGVNITAVDGAAINIQSSKKITVKVLTGTNNRLTDASNYAVSTEDQKATFFSEGQLLFSGLGTLTINGNYKHGICSDDYIYIQEGNIVIAQAVSDGIHANDYLKIDGGTLQVNANGDGLECEEGYILINGGTHIITSGDDGIVASYDETDAAITPYLKINGGQITVTTTGEKANALSSESYTTISGTGQITLSVSGQGAKGIKTGGDCTLSNGTLLINTTGTAFYDTDDADIASPAGINCDGNLTVSDGILTITSTGAGGKGITVDGNMIVENGTLTIKATGTVFTYGSDESEAKGIKTDGNFTQNGGSISITATDDGIKSEATLQINNGTLNIAQSLEGLEAPYISLAGGNIYVTASDDAINATHGNGGESSDGSILTLSGATVALNSTGGDAMDSNGDIVMTAGIAIVQGPPAAPEVAIDYNGNFTISGGILLASGPNAGQMIQTPGSGSTQNTALLRFASGIAANALIHIQDANGNALVTYAPTRTAYYFVCSSPLLRTGTSFNIYTGGTITGATNTNGYYTGGTYSGGTLRGSFTINGYLTSKSL